MYYICIICCFTIKFICILYYLTIIIQTTENYRTYTNVHLDLRRNHFIQIQPPAFSILLHMF